MRRHVARKVFAVVREPARLIIADGNAGGSLVTPELKDLGIAQSCRGYYPHAISHYKAPWANKDPGAGSAKLTANKCSNVWRKPRAQRCID